MKKQRHVILYVSIFSVLMLSFVIGWGASLRPSLASDLAAAPAQIYTLQGRVYEGDTGIESSPPLQGVTVSLYCSNNHGDQGSFLRSTLTDANGWYGLVAREVCEFYNIIETDPAGYVSNGATTVGGTVINANWIEYTYPLSNKTLTGNKFWDRLSATHTPTPTPRATDTPTATFTPTPHATDTPTATSTSTPRATDTPTATPTLPSAATDTPTATFTPTPRATDTPTATSTLPSAATNTPTATPTSTPRATVTPTPTPTATATGIPGTADLAISKTFSLAEPVAPGSYGYYRIRVENQGPEIATNVVVTDTLPAQFAFDTGPTFCSKIASRPPNDIVRCTLSSVNPGIPVEFVLYGAFDNDACGTVFNEAEVHGDQADPFPYDNHAFLDTVIAPCDRPALVVHKRLIDPPHDPVTLGDVVTFAIDIWNIGDRPLSPVPLEDHFFDIQSLGYVSASPQPDQFMASGTEGTMRWVDLTGPAPHGFGQALAPGAHFTVEVRLRAKRTGWGRNCAQVTIDAYDIQEGDCDFIDIIDPEVDLNIDKRLISPSSGLATVGQMVEFEIRLANISDVPITSISLQDIYDPNILSFQWAGLHPDDPTDDGQLDWSNIIAQTGPPLAPHATLSFTIRFQAKQPTPLGLLTRNCIEAGYQHEQDPIVQTPQRCARLAVKAEEGPALAISKILYAPPGGVAAPGDIVQFSFVITNTGTTTLTNVALTDLYDTNCLRFTPTGWPPSWHLAPDDPSDDGQLDWSHYAAISMPPQWRLQVWPGVKFIAKAGTTCDPTINHLEALATDAGGNHATAQDDAPVSIRGELAPRADFGDAPCEINHPGVGMTAYPAGGPPGVGANYPTVYDPTIGAFGPIHRYAQIGAWLGDAVTAERNADLPPDADGVTNIDPQADVPDRDDADDGLQLPLSLPHCQPSTFTFVVTFPAGAPQTDYYLNAWFDWNRNGQWGEELDCGTALAKEWAVQNMLIPFHAPGTYTFTTPTFLPWQPQEGAPLWLRLTLSEQPARDRADGSGPADGYDLGETEDYYLPFTELTPTPTPTPRLTPTPTPTPRLTPTPTPTPRLTPTPTPRLTPTPTPTPRLTSTPTPQFCCLPLYLPLVLRS